MTPSERTGWWHLARADGPERGRSLQQAQAECTVGSAKEKGRAAAWDRRWAVGGEHSLEVRFQAVAVVAAALEEPDRETASSFDAE